MKKIVLSLLFLFIILITSSCEKPVDINEERSFVHQETVEYDGVIYEYYDRNKVVPNLEDKSTEYMFCEEEDYKAYYDYYYYDMSDYKNQKEMKPLSSMDYINKQAFDSDIELSPTSAYYYRVSSVLSPQENSVNNNGFIVKGYTEDLAKNVKIPDSLFGHKVRQIGFKAFENAPMETFYWHPSGEGFVHPYAFNNCNNLEKMYFGYDINIASMGISNCARLQQIKGRLCVLGDCVCYNLPNLISVEDISFGHIEMIDYRFCSNQGGIRKSIFYKCPKFENIEDSRYVKIDNVIYAVGYIPIFVLDNYVVRLSESGFKKNKNIFSVLYNPDTLEAYLPFLDDGLDKKGTFIIPENSDVFVVEDDGIYAYVSYENIDYNAKVLIHKK
ncbi:MAG: leucine-rich repeat domain-containing protein [Anaeroplasmataceae bacterium]|nr:leucine-rich repeat domain-containing protein [Anaeroplasmataceae bacterium]